jgi:hypothetical protein
MPIRQLSYKTDSDVVKSEPHLHAGRDDVVLAAGSGVVQCGTLLGVVTATGLYRPWNPAATDGSQTAAGIILQQADATAVARTVVALTRGTAEVVAQALVWPAGSTTPQRNAALASLEQRLITARNGV